MNIVETALPQVLILEPTVFKDNRGSFMEMYHEGRYQEAGLPRFVQDNLSSSSKNVVRGLHYQLKNPQGKLVSVLRGEVLDIVVDIRQGSPTFGQWISILLNEENRRQVYVPPGFAHGFSALSDDVLFHYKCSRPYDPQDEYGLLWSDYRLDIAWPSKQKAIISAKDAALPSLEEAALNQLPVYSP